jgi:hypothetical protein
MKEPSPERYTVFSLCCPATESGRPTIHSLPLVYTKRRLREEERPLLSHGRPAGRNVGMHIMELRAGWVELWRALKSMAVWARWSIGGPGKVVHWRAILGRTYASAL